MLACLLLGLPPILSPSPAMDWALLHSNAETRVWHELTPEAKQAGRDPAALYELGLIALTARADKEAQAYFRRALEAAPDAPGPKWGIAEVKRRLHELEAAEALLGEVLAEAPGFGPALLTLGYIRFTRADFGGCLRLAQRVVDAGPGATDATNYARALVLAAGAKGMLAHHHGLIAKIRHGTQVRGLLERAAALRPEEPAVLVGLGSYHLFAPGVAGGDREKAMGLLKKASERDPLLPDAWIRLGQAYWLSGDKQKYRECLAKAEAIDPKNELLADIKSGAGTFVSVGDYGRE
jgi:tetratricopeptide (TPR) repeat protein